jgi:hypothetical protein
MDSTIVRVFADTLIKSILLTRTYILRDVKAADVPVTPDCFGTQHPDVITLEDYIWRFVRYCDFSPMVYYIALCLIDLAATSGKIVLTDTTMHKVFASALAIAVKIHDDEGPSNSALARIIGVPVDTLNDMEMRFFAIINFSAFTTLSEVRPYYNAIAQLADQIRCPAPVSSPAPTL